MAIKVDFVGAGRRARNLHAPSLSRCPEITFGGVWSRSPKIATELAAAHGVIAFNRYEDLLNTCDAIDFAVPPAVQAELAPSVALRHKPLLLEIPIAADVAGAEELASAVASGAVVSQVALTWRYAVAVRRFLNLQVPKTPPQGGIDKLMFSAFAAGSATATWRLERGKRMLGPRLIDMLDAALGPVADVLAHGDLDGWVGLAPEHERGRFSDAPLSGTVDVERDRGDIEIFGPGGAAAIDCAGVVGRETYEAMYSEFAACVAEGVPHEMDVRRGLHRQRVVGAAATDLLRKQPITVSPGR
ncbi:MAG: putative oxidoreductase protein [Frankiales bacterium]|nr:putative oxidoreductase protein [Frankiales bacterium]